MKKLRRPKLLDEVDVEAKRRLALQGSNLNVLGPDADVDRRAGGQPLAHVRNPMMPQLSRRDEAEPLDAAP